MLFCITVASTSCWLLVCHDFLQVLLKIPNNITVLKGQVWKYHDICRLLPGYLWNQAFSSCLRPLLSCVWRQPTRKIPKRQPSPPRKSKESNTKIFLQIFWGFNKKKQQNCLFVVWFIFIPNLIWCCPSNIYYFYRTSGKYW